MAKESAGEREILRNEIGKMRSSLTGLNFVAAVGRLSARGGEADTGCGETRFGAHDHPRMAQEAASAGDSQIVRALKS